MTGIDSERSRHERQLRWILLGLRLLVRWRPSTRQILLTKALLVGVLGALAAYGFKLACRGIQYLLTGQTGGYVETMQSMDAWHRLLVPLVGGLMAGAVLHFGQKVENRKATEYMEAVALGDGDVPVRPSLLRSCSSLFSISSGASIGREGPLVQLAAIAASILGRLRREPPARRRLLVACGAAAGIAAAYNTPIAGALFVAEIILGSIAMESLGPLLLSSMAATLTTRSLEPTTVLYHLPIEHAPSAGSVPIYILLGVVCGLASPLFIQFLRRCKMTLGSIPIPSTFRLAAGGLVFGFIAMRFPEVAGNGQSIIDSILSEGLTWQLVGILLACKILAVAAVFGSGAVGGVFTPSLVVGASLGFLTSLAAQSLGATGVEPCVGAVIGMGAFMSAAAQAPIMSILLLFEMTLNPTIVLPLMAASVAAFFVARGVSSESLYGESLRAGPRSVFDKPLASLRVQDMVRPHFAKASSSAGFAQIAALFLRASEGLVPVADNQGRYVGAVLLSDVKPYLKDRDLADAVIAHDIMRDDLPVLESTHDLAEAMRIFSNTGYETLPVIDRENGRLRGLLGRGDLFLVISEVTRRDPLTV